MFNHVMLGSNDIQKTKAFYDATLGALGGTPGTMDANGRLIYRNAGGTLMISKPIDGQPACGANGGTLGFKASSPEQATAWHTAGTQNGGTAIEDAPGVRPNGAFLAYLRDPDGNKLCVVHRPA